MKKSDRILLKRARREKNRAGRQTNHARRVYHRLTDPPPPAAPPLGFKANSFTRSDAFDALRYAHYGATVRTPKLLGTFTSA